MKRIVLMFCFLFLCSFCLNAKDPLLITLKLIPEEQVLGCPVKAIVEVKNEGKDGVKIPPSSQHRYVFTLKCDCNEGIYFNKKGTFEGQVKWELLDGGKEKVYEIEEFLWPYPKKAGSYKIYAEYDPFAYQMVSEEERRESIILSERVSLSVKSPTGIDLEAYNYFKGEPLSKPQELLQKFPTSTYAGYARFVLQTSGPQILILKKY